MKSTLALLLLGLIALSALTPIVRADDDGEGSGGSGGEETPAPKPKAKPAKKAKAKAAKPAKALPKVDVPLEALSKLPVGPLAMDAAALKEDDTLFDQLPKSLSGTENVEALTSSLKRAAALLAKMKRDVEGEKVWTKNVYDIIQNYQYKYLKTVQDVKEREAKVAKMEKLVKRLKQSTLHSAVERELSKASKALGELVTRSDAGGAVYAKVTARMAKLKNALKTMPRPRQLFSETTHKMQKILKSSIPPHTSDALRELTGSAAAPKPAAKPAAKKPAAKAAKKVVAKKAAPKKAKKVVKKAPKKAAKKTTKKAKKAAPKKAKKAKKAAPKKKAAEEEDDE